MAPLLFLKLFAIIATIALGWLAGRTRPFAGADTARIVSNAAFYVFAPALLFRATARIDLHALPWRALAAFFIPTVAWLLAVYVQQRRRRRPEGESPARPATRAIAAAFGNNAQLGIPMAAALFGEAGLQLHLSIVSLHALVLLTLLTALAELDLARAAPPDAAGTTSRRHRLALTLALTVRNTVVHPIVLPVIAGLGWNLLGLPLPGPLDELLVMLGSAVVPVSLVAIGLSLRHYGLRSAGLPALWLSAGKLLAQPTLVFAVSWFAAGLRGVPLAVMTMAAGMPIGVNALLFAQRYRTNEAETTSAIVASTLAFAATAPLWLLVLSTIGATHAPP